MNKHQLKEIIKTLSGSQSEIAKLLSLDPRNLGKYLNGCRPIPPQWKDTLQHAMYNKITEIENQICTLIEADAPNVIDDRVPDASTKQI